MPIRKQVDLNIPATPVNSVERILPDQEVNEESSDSVDITQNANHTAEIDNGVEAEQDIYMRRNSHKMVTRSKDGISKPNPKYALKNEVADITEPTSVKTTLAHPGWLKAMQEELSALEANKTWELVPKQPDMNIIGVKWVYKVKYHA